MNKPRRGLFLAAGILCVLNLLFSFLAYSIVLMALIALWNGASASLSDLPPVLMALVQWASLAVSAVAFFLLWRGRSTQRLLAGGILGEAVSYGILALMQMESLYTVRGTFTDDWENWARWVLCLLLMVLLLLVGLSLWGTLSRRWLLPTAVGGLVLMAALWLLSGGTYMITNPRAIWNIMLIVLSGCGARIAILLIAIGLRAMKIEEE